MSQLFSPMKLGQLQLQNHIVMAPMTRCRAINNIANDLMALYYEQRSEAGLIITEGVSPSPNGLGYARMPGLFNANQAESWKPVTDRVHKKGAKIFVQMMHSGRVSHSANMPSGARIIAPSAIKLEGNQYTDAQGMQPYPMPEEMSEVDIQNTITEFVQASRLAMNAGFDGVELHGANGYLIDQFLNTATNKRTDKWGTSSITNRIRFTLEVAKQVGEAIGFDRVGIRLSPYGVFSGMQPDSELENCYETLAIELGKLRLVYVHLVDHSSMGAPVVSASVKQKIKDGFKGTIILSGGYDAERAEIDLTEKKGDLVAFGRPFISNPNLPSKLKDKKPLNAADHNTFYSPGAQGYTDYPM